MRNFLKMLSVLVVGGTTAFSVVACNRCSTNNGSSVPPDNKFDTYNVSFKEITTAEAIDFIFGGLSKFLVYEKDILGASDLPSNMWDKNSDGVKFVKFFAISGVVWDKIASVYGFNRNSTKDEINELMKNNSIINVSMRMHLVSGASFGSWDLYDFSASLSKK